MQEIGCTKSVSVRGMRTESLPFTQIPGQSKLFLQYQSDPLSLRHFYPSAVAKPSDLKARVAEVLESYSADRDVLCDALVEMNSLYGCGTATTDNIERLRQADSVAVITGQQTGLLTGPLYTIYKALSAVKMAEKLTAEGVNAVPVFWMATEDHDAEEVSTAFAIGHSNDIISASSSASDAEKGFPVGRIGLDADISDSIRQFFAGMPETEFSEALFNEIADGWKPSVGFGDAFGKMLTRLLGKFGLIVADPLHPALKRIASPIYAEAVRYSGEITKAIHKRSEELVKSGYHAQVLVEDDYFPLFRQSESGTRNSIRRVSDDVLADKETRQRFTDSELYQLAVEDPERLSPGVMLRPVVQDHIFPTICYFGGAAEIAYFAQNSEAYRILGRPVTPILHRQSFTLVEPAFARTMQKYGLSLTDLFAGEAAVLPEMIDKFIDPGTAKLFADVEERVNTEMNRLDQALSQMDVTLAENLATRRRKVLYHIAALRKKYHYRRAEKDEVINRRIRALFTSLWPHEGLQERVVNIVSFLDRYGDGVIDWIYDSADLEDKGHRVIYL